MVFENYLKICWIDHLNRVFIKFFINKYCALVTTFCCFSRWFEMIVNSIILFTILLFMNLFKYIQVHVWHEGALEFLDSGTFDLTMLCWELSYIWRPRSSSIRSEVYHLISIFLFCESCCFHWCNLCEPVWLRCLVIYIRYRSNLVIRTLQLSRY
jgi:hypothetical protein